MENQLDQVHENLRAAVGHPTRLLLLLGACLFLLMAALPGKSFAQYSVTTTAGDTSSNSLGAALSCPEDVGWRNIYARAAPKRPAGRQLTARSAVHSARTTSWAASTVQKHLPGL